MTAFVLIKTDKEREWKARCKRCGHVLCSDVSEEHFALVLLEHAAEHDRN